MSLRILVVEYNLDDLLVTERALRKLPMPAEYEIADNGEKALRLLSEKAYDLVLLDVKMPRLNGLDVLQQTNANRDRVVVFSSSSEPRDITAAMDAGAKAFLTKPVDMDEYVKAIHQVCQQAADGWATKA